VANDRQATDSSAGAATFEEGKEKVSSPVPMRLLAVGVVVVALPASYGWNDTASALSILLTCALGIAWVIRFIVLLSRSGLSGFFSPFDWAAGRDYRAFQAWLLFLPAPGEPRSRWLLTGLFALGIAAHIPSLA
jgi:hypothetical protein